MESNESICLFIKCTKQPITTCPLKVAQQMFWPITVSSATLGVRLDCRVLAYASTYLLIYLQVSARKELISGSRVSMIVMVAVWILPVLNSLCVVVSVKLTEKVSFDSISAVRITGIWTQPRLVLAAILAGNVPP